MQSLLPAVWLLDTTEGDAFDYIRIEPDGKSSIRTNLFNNKRLGTRIKLVWLVDQFGDFISNSIIIGETLYIVGSKALLGGYTLRLITGSIPPLGGPASPLSLFHLTSQELGIGLDHPLILRNFP
jgi:hypothetical protein